MNDRPTSFREALRITRQAVGQTVRADVPRTQRGVALLVALATIAILIALSGNFAYNQMTNIWMSGNITATTRAYWSARGTLKVATLAVNAQKNFPQMSSALALLGRSSKGAARIEIWRQSCEFAKIFCTGRASFFGMDLLDFTKEEAVGLKRGECACEVSAEDGRVNLNAGATDTAAAVATTLATGNRSAPQSRGGAANRRLGRSDLARNQLGLQLYGRFRPMLDSGEFDSEEEIIDLILNIMDWTDSDDTKTDVSPDGRFMDGGGAEAADYGKYGYETKNAKMDTVGEVQLVEGMTSDVYCKVRDDLTVFSTDKINVNDANILILRGILCEAITDETLRAQYCYDPSRIIGLQPQAIDEVLMALEQCRILKKQVYSTPFTSMSRFMQFFRQYPQATGGTAIPLNQGIVNQQLGVRTKMVRIKATGSHCWREDCKGICPGEQGGDGERKLCSTDEDCGGGFCQKKISTRSVEAIMDTSTGSLVHYTE